MDKPVRFLILLCALVCAFPVRAQPEEPISEDKLEAARQRFKSGQANFKGGQFEAALTDFRVVDAIVGKPTSRVAVAVAYEKLGRLVEALETARSVQAIPASENEKKALMEAREDAAALVKALEARVARVTFVSSPPALGVELVLNDRTLTAEERTGKIVDPGRKHILRAHASGYQSVEQVFELVEGEKREIRITLHPVQAPPSLAPVPTTSSETSFVVGPVTWTGIGIAGAGIIVGAVAGGVAASRKAELQRDCTAGDGNDCAEPYHELRRDALTAAHVSTAGFVLAGVGVGVSLVGLFGLDRPSPKSVAIVPVITPGSVGVRGVF